MKPLPSTHKSSSSRLVRTALVALLVLLALWLAGNGLLAGLLYSRLSRVRQWASDPGHVQLASLAAEVHGTRGEFDLLHAGLSPLLWLSSRCSGDLGAVAPLADAGSEVLAAADEALAGLSPSMGTVELSSLSVARLPALLDSLSAARSDLAAAQDHMDLAAADLQRIRGPLSSRLDHWSSLAVQAVHWARQGLQAAQIAPALLGQAGSRTYLLLLENPDELRATGGFISAVGLVQVDHGKLGPMSVQDSYALEDFTKYHPDPPQALLEYMLTEQWVLRDANWSPDFPTTARDAVRLYQIPHPGPVDGVIAITVQGVELFINGLGPLNVSGLPEPVTAANFGRILQETWNPPPDLGGSQAELDAWFANRKQAIGTVMTAAVDRVLSGRADWVSLGKGLLDAFDQRQLMLYTDTEAVALQQIGWDGSLRPASGDYLMLVDSNVGFNKANSLITETVEYQVALNSDGTARAAVDVDYTHHGQQAGVLCRQFKKYDQNVTYDSLKQTCYYDDLRVLVPSGSSLVSSAPQPASAEALLPGVPAAGLAQMVQDASLHKSVIDQFFVVEYGRRLLAHFEYDLPAVVSDLGSNRQYTLFIQKQAGTDAVPIQVSLTLPPGARFLFSNPLPSARSGSSLEYDLRLDVDQQVNLTYSLAP